MAKKRSKHHGSSHRDGQSDLSAQQGASLGGGSNSDRQAAIERWDQLSPRLQADLKDWHTVTGTTHSRLDSVMAHARSAHAAQDAGDALGYAERAQKASDEAWFGESRPDWFKASYELLIVPGWDD